MRWGEFVFSEAIGMTEWYKSSSALTNIGSEGMFSEITRAEWKGRAAPGYEREKTPILSKVIRRIVPVYGWLRGVILLAEDGEGDIRLITEAFRRANIPNRLLVVKSGQEVVDYFKEEGNLPNERNGPYRLCCCWI